jgi:hypothetical protein
VATLPVGLRDIIGTGGGFNGDIAWRSSAPRAHSVHSERCALSEWGPPARLTLAAGPQVPSHGISQSLTVLANRSHHACWLGQVCDKSDRMLESGAFTHWYD